MYRDAFFYMKYAVRINDSLLGKVMKIFWISLAKSY